MLFRTLSRTLGAAVAAGVTLGVAAAAPSAASATEIQRVISPSGVEIWLVEEYAIPIISVEMSFMGGASRDPEGQSGRAAFYMAMLDEGAGPYDTQAFNARKNEIAARLSFDSGRDRVDVSLTMLADRRDESVELVNLALSQPRFEAAAVERVRAQIVSRLRQQEADPQSIASRRWLARAFPDHSYGRSRWGEEATIAAMSVAQLRDAQPELINRTVVKVAVVGAISADEVGPMVDAILEGVSGEALPALPATDPVIPAGVEVVAYDAPQSTVMFGHVGILRDDPDFIPAFVMNYILGGGGFASRLTEEVRRKRGLAYSVYSYLSPFDRAGLYLGGVSTANERVKESIELIEAEWRRMAEEGPTAEELEAAQRYLIGSYPLSFDSNAKIARILLRVQRQELGIDYIDQRNDLIAAVTIEDVQRVAQRLLLADALYFTVVGQPVDLETTIDIVD